MPSNFKKETIKANILSQETSLNNSRIKYSLLHSKECIYVEKNNFYPLCDTIESIVKHGRDIIANHVRNLRLKNTESLKLVILSFKKFLEFMIVDTTIEVIASLLVKLCHL
jgi:hypothetical protein